MAPIDGPADFGSAPSPQHEYVVARGALQPRRRGSALAAFESVRDREIPDFDAFHLPAYGSIVVTGGTGCIGTAVLRLLRARGISQLTSISRRPPMASRQIPHVDYRLADIRDPEGIRTVLRSVEPELVIHLAGQRQPDLAEQNVAHTVSSNVFGTKSILMAAGQTGVGAVVTASTGKALRFFASEVYASSKKLAEHLVSQAPGRWGVSCATVRFTHVVDNSLIYRRLRRWARTGVPIRLHAPGIGFYAQSAREAAQLLAVAAGALDSGRPTVSALFDIGWPHDLLELAMDVIDDEASRSTISFSGYEPGYENQIFPGTFDPLRSDRSPLFNALEAGRVVPERPGDPVANVPLATDHDVAVDQALVALERCWRHQAGDRALRATLHEASTALLKRTFSGSTADELAGVCRLAIGKVGETPEHVFIYRHLLEAAESAGALSLVGSGAPSRSNGGED